MSISTTYYLKRIALLSAFALPFSAVQAQDTAAVKPDTVLAEKQRKGYPLSGTITDAATKKGFVGVRVQVENFSAAITDENGNFTLNVPSYHTDILVSADGYEPRQISLKGRTSVNEALLDETHSSFQELVTMPLSTNLHRTVAAAVSKYDNKVGWGRPDETLDALLQGQVAGLNAIRRSGTPGAGANMFLRGYNSLFATNKPLIVIDGMLYDANDYGESIIANNYTNPLALIDVKDIDNITVLKDAASIYGTKGANGAIIVTTARAQQQATRIDFGAYTGVSLAPQRLPVMNAYLPERSITKQRDDEQ